MIDKIKYQRPEVLSGPEIGEDCAVLDFGSYECVVSTDPITAAIEMVGTLAIHVSCNDIASNGIEPIGVLLTVLLPPETSEIEIEKIMTQAADAAASLGVGIIGGHTEITDAVTKPIISSTAIGKGRAGHVCRTKVRPGDHILVTKKLAMEGTGIIAAEHADALRGVLTEAEIAEAVSMLSEISVVKEGVLAGSIGVSAMHDITEGGVLGATWELCRLADLGAEIRRDVLPLAAVTEKICAHYGLDPLKLISSGSMMIIARPEASAKIMTALRDARVDVAQIGSIRDKADGIYLVSKTAGDGSETARDGSHGPAPIIENESAGIASELRVPVLPPGSDEIYKVK
ncbi:MAG: AIR synthase family protein [Clostridiales Family XIII bacterium]|nr:AIR synthase family protein [Clostridiales Family XIII bacterium]